MHQYTLYIVYCIIIIIVILSCVYIIHHSLYSCASLSPLLPPSSDPPLRFLFSQIGGLQLEGCTFDGSRLLENKRDSPSVTTMPACSVAWVTKETPSPYPEGECLSLPIYFSSDRDKLVACLDVPCGLAGAGDCQAQWVQTGAALFLKNQ